MSNNLTDRIANTANSYIGGAKQTVGETLGYPDLAANGAQQKAQAEASQAAANAQAEASQAAAKAQAEASQAAANAQRQVEGAGHQLQGKIEKTVGALTNDTTLEAQGHANEVRGNVETKV
ncbi:hypothetical protein BGZ46_010803 [Entomortierella lignicola]|nr:hypothetical protein BGZ46_010803 [Entomortierella lignicola]KAF9207576.1 hypothetical protein BGZ49_000107 [Haplosporangium sp. Z 27]